MQAIILAAGMGRRLGELTKDKAKCMITVNDITLIERMLKQLDKFKLSRIILVVGFEHIKLMDFINSLNVNTDIVYIENPVYDKTNNIYSLSLASDYLISEDSLILESDLIFEDKVLEELLKDKRDTLALVDKYEGWMDGTVIKINDEDIITDIISGAKMDFSENDYYKTVNIYKFGKEFSTSLYVPFLRAYLHALGNNQYYEQVLRVITILDEPIIRAKRLSGELWYEVDNIQDMDIAASMFEPDDDKKLKLFQERYGGYWRYPKLIDFCYLVNPFFPPPKLINELKFNIENLISAYPSGLNVNTLIAAKKYDVRPEYIIIGNGAAELIKLLIEGINDKIGFIYPTFEEYPNRLAEEKRVVFTPENQDFSYSAQDIINFYNDKDIAALIIINPDNPSGNYMDKNSIFALLDWSVTKNILLVIDESFIDFSYDYPFTLIDNNIVEKYRNLIVVKSISKSYGVPGLRLGVLVTSDEKLVKSIKKDLPIWNINSFAEFYMQIEEKYKPDYVNSLVMLKKTREKFVSDLIATGVLRIIPSQADFVMAEVLKGLSAHELTKTLLINHNILIKDLSSKLAYTGRQYVRIAVKNEDDNNKLINALNEIL